MMRIAREPGKAFRARRSDQRTIPLIAGEVKPLIAVRLGKREYVPRRRSL
jgi:hypothetical protein